MNLDPRVKKAAPWIVGGGLAVGLFLIMRGRSAAGEGDDGSASDGYDPYSPQYLAGVAQLAQSQADAGAKITMAQGQANAIQTAAQAELIAAQGAQAQAIGETYATILGVVSQPQLQAMQEASRQAGLTIQAATANQLNTTDAYTRMVNNYVANVNATGQAALGRVADVSALAIGAGVSNARTVGQTLSNIYGGGSIMGQAGGFMAFA